MNDTTIEITNKARAKRRYNKIASIVCLAIVGVLILTTILLAVIPVNTGARFVNKPDQIYLKINSTFYQVDKDSEDYNKIYNAYQNGSRPTVITTIFGGYAGKGMSSNYTASPQSFSNLSNETTFEVVFYWNELQTMINPNGSNFTYKIGESISTQPVQFREVHFAVKNENSVSDNTFYIKNTTNDTTSTRFTYTGVANYNGLYKVLNQMVEDGKFTPVA